MHWLLISSEASPQKTAHTFVRDFKETSVDAIDARWYMQPVW